VRARDFLLSKAVKICPGAHPACTMGNGALSLREKWSEHGVDHPPPSCSKIEWVELYLFLPALAQYMATFTFVYLYLY